MLAYKSFQKGFNQKFQEIAELRKSLEAQKQQTTSWTPEKLQQEMNKPDFVQAAQQIIKTQNPKESGLTDEEWSTLSEAEKTKLNKMEQELQALKQQTFLNEMRAQNLVEDERLKTKYSNYNPQAIDTITADLLANKVKATREHLWKAIDYEDAGRRAYELGKADKKLETQEKITSMSTTGTTVVGDESVPKMEEGETSKQYFLRLAGRRLQQSASGQIKK